MDAVDLRKDGHDGTAFFGRIVQAATAGRSGEEIRTPLACRRGTRRRACPGCLVVRRQDIPAEIRWHCPACTDGGRIIGWRGSVWDYTSLRSEGDREEVVETQEVLLTEDQWRFLAEQVITDGLDTARTIAAGVLTDDGVLLAGGLDDLEDLAGCVASAANHSPNSHHRRVSETILDRLDEVLQPDRSMPPALVAFQATFAKVLQQYNTTSQTELGDLSPERAFRLFEDDWESPGGAVRLNPDLAPADLGAARLPANARIFLDVLALSGGARMTAAGNLNRAFVERMFDEMALPADYREMVLSVSKKLNERDLWPLHVLRVLLYLAGLLRRWKGEFRITKAGDRLRSPEHVGELYRRLFITLFRKMNLAYLDRLGPEAAAFQHTISFSFYRFASVGEDWRTLSKLTDLLLFPRTREEISSEGLVDLRPPVVRYRFLQPLEWFGLAESQSPSGSQAWLDLAEKTRYRKTPLYDRFLKFDV